MDRLKEAWLIAQVILNLAPQIMGLVAEVEKVTTASGVAQAGAQKAGLVVGFITSALDLLPDNIRGLVAVEKIAAVAQKIVDVVVKFYNATGIFGKKPNG